MTTKPATITDKVYEAIENAFANHQPCTYAVISSLTNLSTTQIKEALDRLRETGRVASRTRGVFVPTQPYADPRPVSRTILANGMEKLEIGDFVIDLTPVEAQSMMRAFGLAPANWGA